jgi:hypothetical protein
MRVRGDPSPRRPARHPSASFRTTWRWPSAWRGCLLQRRHAEDPAMRKIAASSARHGHVTRARGGLPARPTLSNMLRHLTPSLVGCAERTAHRKTPGTCFGATPVTTGASYMNLNNKPRAAGHATIERTLIMGRVLPRLGCGINAGVGQQTFRSSMHVFLKFQKEARR